MLVPLLNIWRVGEYDQTEIMRANGLTDQRSSVRTRKSDYPLTLQYLPYEQMAGWCSYRWRR